MDGYPFPEIYIAAGAVNTDSGETTELLVDGQQRVRTIDEYFRGARPFNTGRSITTYANLPEGEKKKFLSYDVAIRNMGMISDEQIREAFRRMNATSYNLNNMERYNAVYLGEFKKLAEKVASSEAFTRWRIFSPNDIRRMKDVSYATSLMATIMSNYFHRDEDIEEYLENYNEEFKDSSLVASRVSEASKYIDELDLPKGLRVWGKADFYNLFVEVDRQLFKKGHRPDARAASDKLVAFYAAVSDARNEPPADPTVKKYYEATLQAANDRSARVARGEIIQEVLEGVPGDDFKFEGQNVDVAEMLNVAEDDVEGEMDIIEALEDTADATGDEGS
jgi:hypothetical protein